jgi:hypothetical protein
MYTINYILVCFWVDDLIAIYGFLDLLIFLLVCMYLCINECAGFW